MKKMVVSFLLFIILPMNIFAISADKAVVMDLNSGRVLYDLNKDEPQLIASITKIMTCLIAINYSDLDKIVVVDEDILKAYGSSVYLEVGEGIKLIDKESFIAVTKAYEQKNANKKLREGTLIQKKEKINTLEG